MSELVTFGSSEEMQEYMRKLQEDAIRTLDNPGVAERLRRLVHGMRAFLWEENLGIPIFGEIMEETGYPDDTEHLKESRSRGYLFGRWWSVMCPEGELGSNHVTRVVPLAPQVFHSARYAGWEYKIDQVHLTPASIPDFFLALEGTDASQEWAVLDGENFSTPGKPLRIMRYWRPTQALWMTWQQEDVEPLVRLARALAGDPKAEGRAAGIDASLLNRYTWGVPI